MSYKVFVDGAEGTTGLKIHERLAVHGSVQALMIEAALRKDPEARRKLMLEADVVFLCLPDAAAKEAVKLSSGSNAIIIDASTAHRTADEWAYGFPELSSAHRQAIASAKRIAVPGCHATGMIAAVYPLVCEGIIKNDYPVSVHSITGYSGGGKKMIAEYESNDRDSALSSPRQYGLSLTHKHLPEMRHVTGLARPPIFNPIVCDYYAGMAVSVPLNTECMQKKVTVNEVYDFYKGFYNGQGMISVAMQPESGFIPANAKCGHNDLTLYVCGNDDMMTIVNVFDNLGKGASGAAVQCMNIALGLPEEIGLKN